MISPHYFKKIQERYDLKRDRTENGRSGCFNKLLQKNIFLMNVLECSVNAK